MFQPVSKVTPFIWLNSEAEEAAHLYVSLIPNSRIVDVSRWGEGTSAAAGSVMCATVELAGHEYILFNGGPHFKQSEAFSIYVNCEDQAEVDRLWNAFTANGGQASQCGWLKDKFGVSWQIIPTALTRLISDPDAARAQRAMQAMLKMQKIDIAALEKAAA